jgi:hypothetical protein
MKKPKRMKQALTTAPKKAEGKKKTAGHDMGGTFGYQPKKPEADMKPRTRASVRNARVARLTNRFI